MSNEKLCECGIVVRGNSKNQLEYNLKVHKKGARHKAQMKFKEENKNK